MTTSATANNQKDKLILSITEFKKKSKNASSAKGKSLTNVVNKKKINQTKSTEKSNQTPAAKLKAAMATASALTAIGSSHPKRSDIKVLLEAHKKGFVNDEAFLKNLQKLVL